MPGNFTIITDIFASHIVTPLNIALSIGHHDHQDGHYTDIIPNDNSPIGLMSATQHSGRDRLGWRNRNKSL